MKNVLAILAIAILCLSPAVLRAEPTANVTVAKDGPRNVVVRIYIISADAIKGYYAEAKLPPGYELTSIQQEGEFADPNKALTLNVNGENTAHAASVLIGGALLRKDVTAVLRFSKPNGEPIGESLKLVDLKIVGPDDKELMVRMVEQTIVPAETKLLQNYPNPFNPVTTIPYSLSQDGQMELAIYNILGQQVRVLASCQAVAGEYLTMWDGQDDRGHPVSSGVYFYRLTATGFRAEHKLLLLK